ncbi:MAG: hypothetical protein IKP31_03790 [Lachnospiraceae bacterium]|nr:hypothetical protein [Lachnospiraceae bacterium]
MKNRITKCILAIMTCTVIMAGCSRSQIPEKSVEEAAVEALEETAGKENKEAEPDNQAAQIEDGTYLAFFDTDSSMFHVNEVSKGKGILTVKDGSMMIHIVMPSKNIVNLFYGLAEDAKKEGAVLIEPVTEEVTYDDGATEEVYAYDVPVPVLNEEYDVALIGKKQVWYDHKVKVSDPEPYDEEAAADSTDGDASVSTSSDEEGLTAEVTLSGGSGKATVKSPAKIREEKGTIIATVEWSSPYYDYMIVDGQRYEPVNTEGNSIFEIPIPGYEQDVTVLADTVAMSKPHEIEYVLNFKK